ncbi:MAG: cyclic nucleotide-binding domain-containing protein [Thermodesulfobacteriota bacterium]
MSKVFGKFFLTGKLEKDLAELQRKAAQEPNNYYLLVKIGDLLEKMGRRQEALKVYRQASEKYTQKGFLVQAIAVNKLILRLDPTQEQIHNHLAQLYVQRDLLAAEIKEGDKGLNSDYKMGKINWPLIPLFADLHREELTRVMDKIEIKQFPAGSMICREGEVGDAIFIISHGQVEVFRLNNQGNKIHLALLQEGDFFGEFAFFTNSRRRASVVAKMDTEILEISKEAMEEVIKEFPSVAQVLLKFYKERILDNLLATSTIFSSLPKEERKGLLPHFILEEYPPRAIILEEGTPGDSLFIIKKGEVEVYTRNQKGEVVSLAKLKEGDFFGEISLITGRPRNASVRALQPTELLRLAKENFIKIVETHPPIKEFLKETLLLRLEDKLRAQGVFQETPPKEGLI